LNTPIDRLFVDISYTRTQTGNIGVTRTVRRLLEEFQQASPISQTSCRPVAIHSSGFREAAVLTVGPSTTSPPRVADGAAAHMLRWITGGHVRRLVLASLPVPLLHGVWRIYSRWTFNTLSQHALPVAFQPGDLLFMGDASWHYEAWQAARQAQRQGARVVLMVHDLIPLRHLEFCAPLVSRVFQQWLPEMVSVSNAIVCNSAAVETDLRDYAAAIGLRLPPTGHFRLGCDPMRSSNGQVIRPAIANFLSKPGASFVAVGSFEPRKNYAWLLKLFERLWSKGHNVRLLIAGRPTADGQALIEKMKRHPEQGQKLLTVFDASDDELDHVYAQARALLFPSLAEGFGLPLVEARTRGCMVIASDLPAFLELADQGVALCASNSFDDMEGQVIAHAALDRRTLVAPMPIFTWNESAHQCLGLMANLLAERPHSEHGPTWASVHESRTAFG